MASIYKSLAAFTRNLEVWAFSVKKLQHHIKINRALKNDINLCIWAMSTASKIRIPLSFILKPLDSPDITIYTDASKIGIGGWSTTGHFFQLRWKDVNISKPNMKDMQWMELSLFLYVFMR